MKVRRATWEVMSCQTGGRFFEDSARLLVFPRHNAVEGTTDGATEEVKEFVVVASVHVVGWGVVVVTLKDFVDHVPIYGACLKVYTGMVARFLLSRFIDITLKVGRVEALGVADALAKGTAQHEVIADFSEGGEAETGELHFGRKSLYGVSVFLHTEVVVIYQADLVVGGRDAFLLVASKFLFSECRVELYAVGLAPCEGGNDSVGVGLTAGGVALFAILTWCVDVEGFECYPKVGTDVDGLERSGPFGS